MTTTTSPAGEFLANFTVGDLSASTHQHVVHGDENTTVEQAMGAMNRNKLVSLPLFSKARGEYTGLVNLFDITTAISFQQLFQSYEGQGADAFGDDLRERVRSLAVWSTPVQYLLGISDESRSLWTAHENDSLKALVSIFTRGVHRVLALKSRAPTSDLLCAASGASPAASHAEHEHAAPAPAPAPAAPASATLECEADNVARIVSQTDVVRFLHANSTGPSLRGVFSRTIEELDLAPSAGARAIPLVTLDEHATALTGFQKLTLHDVSALAVTSAETGRLVSTLSTSDVRGLSRAQFTNVLLPVLDYLRVMRGNPVELVTCVTSDTLDAVTARILAARVHRAWIVDDHFRPIGVVTLSDILSRFTSASS